MKMHMDLSEKNSVFLELSSLNSNESIESKIDLAKHGKKGSFCSKGVFSGSTDISGGKGAEIWYKNERISRYCEVMFVVVRALCLINSLSAGYLAYRV